jgi:hypothetical protein
MGVRVIRKESTSLRGHLKAVSAAIDPGSPQTDRFRTALKKVVIQDNIDMLTHHGSTTFAGEDRFGRDLAPPAASTMARWPQRGLGFVLAPRGLASRPIANFFVRWVLEGKAWKMVAGWEGIPWMKYHLAGSDHHPRHPNWRLPKRDIDGTSLKGWVKVREELARFRAAVLRAGAR